MVQRYLARCVAPRDLGLLPGPASPVRFWLDHFLEGGRACACAYDEVGVAPTCGRSSSVCVRAKLAAAMASCVFRVALETPLAQKRGGAKHIRT